MLNRDDLAELSLRESQVARLAVEGLTVLEMAERLCISRNTVKTHLEHIYQKLGVRNRLEMEHKLQTSDGQSTDR